MLACYYPQGKQLASGVIALLTCQSHYNVSVINTTPCARLLLCHPLDQRIATVTSEGRNILLRLRYSVVTQLLRRTRLHLRFSNGCECCKAIQKKKMVVVFVHKSCLSTFFLLRFFFESYQEIVTVQCKNPIIVTEKYVWGDLRGV